MASIVANVRVEYCQASGLLVRKQAGKGVTVDLQWNGVARKLSLIINLSPKPVTVPLQPPLMMTCACIREGKMGLQLRNAQLHSTEPPMTIQIMLSEAEPLLLLKLRDAVNACMARILRQPLQSLPQNTATQTAGSQASQGSLKRKADSVFEPATSFISAGSSGAAGGVTSKLRPSCDEEDLAALSDEQQHVIDLVTAGKSVFFTGCAGTGKSLVLKHILRALPRDSTFATASTGLAATALGGTTLHAFAGVGRETSVSAALKSASRADARQRWYRAKTLVLDEVSMVDGGFFDLLEEVARLVRGRRDPFGGLQLVLCGDFHQLPPVTRGQGAAQAQARRFCFESAAWKACVHHCLELTQVFRQEDNEFVDLLATIRSGCSSSEVVHALKQRCRDPVNMNGVLATKLFTHREDVDALNRDELLALTSEAVRFQAQDTGHVDALKTSCPAKAVLHLKVGAQVMLTRNLSQARGLVNGARGVVERWVGAASKLPVVRFANGVVTTISKQRWTIASGSKVVATRQQVPLELGWAMSVHKCQGLTLDAVQINLERAFEPGMAYVALSRVKSLEGLQIVGDINSRALQADPKVIAFYEELRHATGESCI